MCNLRIGHGYDVHRFAAGRRLVLGGVEIEHETGLLGHSDADVLLHAIMDALLGAAALGDIGRHFPDTDLRYKDADSMVLLKEACSQIKENGYKIVNIDTNIIAQMPRLSPHIENIRATLAEVMELDISCISVKARTNEGQDSVGEKRSIVAQAVCLLEK